MAAENQTSDNEAAKAAERDAKERSIAKDVEADHKSGKGLRSGWSYNPTRDPKYMRNADAERRRLDLIQSGSIQAVGTPDRALAAGFKDKPALAKKKG